MRKVIIFGPDGIYLTSYPAPGVPQLSERELFRRAANRLVEEGWVTMWDVSSLRFEIVDDEA